MMALSLPAIIADASVDDVAGAAAWSAWVSPMAGRPFWEAGTLPPMSGNAAELQAIGNGLAALFARERPGQHVMVISDSRTALGTILGGVTGVAVADGWESLPAVDAASAPPATLAGLTAIRDLASRTGTRLLLCRLPGHSPHTARGALHSTVDYLARQTMRQARRAAAGADASPAAA